MSALVISGFLMGLFGGAHCVAMCGGVSSVLCAGAGAGGTSRYAFAYNAGRIASYTALGLVAGALGTLTLELGFLRFALRALAALCMLSVGLHLLGMPSFVKAVEAVGAPIWHRIAPAAKRLLPLRSPLHAFAAGLLWAFMPCGLLYGALALAASASSPLMGASTMAAFGLGTLPVMLAVGLVARRVAGAFARGWVRRSAGAVILACGLWSTVGLAGQLGLGAPAHACCPHR